MRLLVDPAGFVWVGDHRWPCALGRGGIIQHKSEGDGATPAGDWALGRVFYRPDRLSAPTTGLMTIALQEDWGWCDDPDHPDYNRLIVLPHGARHEDLWRKDGLYDVIVEILYNVDPIIPGKGSAIFMHIAKPDYAPTEGCIALSRDDLFALLRLCNEEDVLHIPG